MVVDTIGYWLESRSRARHREQMLIDILPSRTKLTMISELSAIVEAWVVNEAVQIVDCGCSRFWR